MQSFTQAYFGSKGAAAASASRDSTPIKAALHLNEMPRDLPASLRERIATIGRVPAFNRYPETFAASLAATLAAWYGCAREQVLVGPGSSGFIRMLLTYFGLHMRGRLVITRPSFAYYEQCCRAFGIDYDTWDLNGEFQYEPRGLETLRDHSVVCLTNPNNPTGNLISVADMRALLRRHPTSLFIVDEAYVDFIDYTMLPLLAEHDNLLLLRTFSKAFAAAGIRCGILIGQPQLIRALGSLCTPWQLSAFTIEAAKVLVEFACETTWIQDQVQEVIAERERLARSCRETGGRDFNIFPSDGNFLLIRAHSPKGHASLRDVCATRGIQVLDLDAQPLMARCIRVSIGQATENALFLSAFVGAVEALRSEESPVLFVGENRGRASAIPASVR